jgi:rhamnose utilization protein RhaD (predicted bifunctional aldolase and dehydrogenase)/NAD(P)-dependent dehydrogenase (short-subunit alcohol dehydrogenase family)
MKSLWSDTEASAFEGDLAQRVYSSRLLGRDRSLVLHGGGNTSVKIREQSLLGDEEEILYVKGSGRDLEFIEAAGFSPVRCARLQRLAQLPRLSDTDMVNELVTHQTRASSPVPSVEAILHAILPHRFVDHTHADAVVTVSNSTGGEARIREIYGARVVVIPYVMPGFDLARECAKRFAAEAGAGTIGMVLLQHGIFSFGASAKESYERMIELVGLAEEYLARHQAWSVADAAPASSPPAATLELAGLRREISAAAGAPMILARKADANCRSFTARPDLSVVARQGPLTPDHVIRTRRLPLVGRDVERYCAEYREYFGRFEAIASERKTMLDPAPRVVLDRELGMCTAGRSVLDADICAEIYEHTMDAIRRATRLGGWCALPAADLFAVEYWDLEQAKLRKGAGAPPFAGEVALVTGAASGIGRACAESLLGRGAAVVGVDINPAISTIFPRPDFLGIEANLGDSSKFPRILARAVDRFGGLDMLILNAGVFPGGRRVSELTPDEWRRVMSINVDANQALLRECHPLLRLAPRGGRVVVIGSKNVPAPGPGAGAYSASKAALTQLARVAALEWGMDNIRVNTLHPNAVFDTGIWTDEVLADRAKHYGMSVEDYKRNNVLRVEVSSRDVAELAAELCGPLFAKTTGAQIPIDGGNDRVI